jgi:hypothetical protein
LSTLSPASACTSTTRSGPTPNFSSTPSRRCAVLHRVEHLDPAADQLHQVLVGRDDRHPPPGLARLAGQRGDDVVGLEALQFLAGDVEGPRRLAGQRDLRAQILGHLVAVGLVEVVKVVAERVAALVEDHRRMGRRIGPVIVLDDLVQHVAKARHRPDGQPVGFARQRRQRVIGAEDERRPVDQMQMMPLAECHVVLQCGPATIPLA